MDMALLVEFCFRLKPKITFLQYVIACVKALITRYRSFCAMTYQLYFVHFISFTNVVFSTVHTNSKHRSSNPDEKPVIAIKKQYTVYSYLRLSSNVNVLMFSRNYKNWTSFHDMLLALIHTKVLHKGFVHIKTLSCCTCIGHEGSWVGQLGDDRSLSTTGTFGRGFHMTDKCGTETLPYCWMIRIKMYLATGSTFVSLALYFAKGESTVIYIIRKMTKLIWELLKDSYMPTVYTN
ncbi:hypothetical protein AGLY_014117 [Aphis glycines]|uniref:Uncharacterized protein n=1 Tax=Aphis glycines TaxID=307491 RepID=A0A6G0T4C7_APHGL|nr:hypothetical protein AGLY_014117 [Aphis glycines]